MAINDTSWSLNEKITSAKLNLMSENELNIANNIHPQYNPLWINFGSKFYADLPSSGAIDYHEELTSPFNTFNYQFVAPVGQKGLKIKDLSFYYKGESTLHLRYKYCIDSAGFTGATTNSLGFLGFKNGSYSSFVSDYVVITAATSASPTYLSRSVDRDLSLAGLSYGDKVEIHMYVENVSGPSTGTLRIYFKEIEAYLT